MTRPRIAHFLLRPRGRSARRADEGDDREGLDRHRSCETDVVRDPRQHRHLVDAQRRATSARSTVLPCGQSPAGTCIKLRRLPSTFAIDR